MRHAGSDVDCLRGKIGILAKLTVDEGGPRFRRWKPMPSREGSPPIAPAGKSDRNYAEAADAAAARPWSRPAPVCRPMTAA